MLKSDNVKQMITEEETEILQEIMNIAFGRAASDLAEHVDIFVIISTPAIKLLKAFGMRWIKKIGLKRFPITPKLAT